MTRHPLLVLLVSALIGALAGLLLGPKPIPLGSATGDPALAAEVAPILAGTGNDGTVSVVRIRDGRSTWAGFGDVTEQSRFEIGSLTKSFNGLLLADAVERGKVALDDTLATHLVELAGTPAGSVTLEELATHTSGLPSMGSMNMLRVIADDLAGAPYADYRRATPESVISNAGSAELADPGTWQYSNLGASLLGFALARAAEAPDWPTLVTERLFVPLGMDQTHIAEPGLPHPELTQPHNPNGTPMGAQTSTGYAPAGIGVTSTAADLARYAEALLAGEAPGMDALTPRVDTAGALPGQQMGLAWVISGENHEIAWHNGMTGGMASMFAVDRARQSATIVLTDRARDVTGAGLVLLADGGDPGLPAIPHIDADTVMWVAAGALLVALFAWASARARSRARLIGQGLAAVGSLLLWGLAQPWDWARPWTFGLAVGLTLGALVVAGRRWSELGWLPQRLRPVTVIVAALGVAWFVAMVAFAGWVLSLA